MKVRAKIMFRLNNNITEDLLKNNSFLKFTNKYYYKRNLYDKKISLNIYINLEEKSLQIEVYDDFLYHAYIPFYNQENNRNNKVLEHVLERYNKIMNDLVEKGILIYD